jgi:hypothetical protein
MRQGLLLVFLFVIGMGPTFGMSTANAAVYWDDDFESPLTGRWLYQHFACSNLSSPCPYLDISADTAHNGTQSLKLFYDTINDYDNSHNVSSSRSFPQTDTTLFTRFYYQTAGTFTYSPSGTHHFYLGDLGVVAVHSGSRAMALLVMHSRDCFLPVLKQDCYASWLATPNVAAVNLNDNQWYCIETQITLNAPSNADAVLRLWVNGSLTLEYKNFRIRGTSPNGPNGNSSVSGLNVIEILKHAGVGRMYFDQFAVGSERINCSNSTNSTTPAPPKNLRVE